VKNRTLAALMVAALAAGFALAQPGPGTAAPAPAGKAQAPMTCGMQGMQSMQGKPGMQGMASMMPDLTADQQGKMDALKTAHLKEMLPLRTDLQVKEIELGALWRADEPDAKKIVAKVKEIGDIREKMEVARVNHLFDCRKLLTPEQLKAMKKMGMGRGMMGKGMGRGMRGMMRGQMGGCPMGGEGCGMQGGGQCGMQGPMGQGGQPGCPDCKMH
jgi:Spy/CpxP family protein refolding chaperone